VLQSQNQLENQSDRKEYSTSMSAKNRNQQISPPGSLHRRSSQVIPDLRKPIRQKTPSRFYLPFQIAGYSIPCERHPLRNEDSFLIDQPCGLMAVFDGVGGSAAGEIASQTAQRATRQRWKQTLLDLNRYRHTHQTLANCDKIDFCTLLQQLLEHADEEVRTDGAQRAGTNDLATTVAIATLCRQGKELHMLYAHVGDSRVYLLPDQGPLRRLTVDDGLLGRLVENQMMSEDDARRIDQAMYATELTDLELSYFRHRGGITQALGGPLRPNIHVDQTTIELGDRVLLCTDGIHDNLTDDEIEKILRHTPRNLAARFLVEHSLTRSRQERLTTIRAKPDDMSAIVMTRVH
jgi:PPM family protein phosphatase